MRTRTEDLLSLRDDEPLDAVTRERLLADPAARDDVERLRRMRGTLQALPMLEPPAEGWLRIEAAVGAPAPRPRLAAACAAAALGIGVAFATLVVGTRGFETAVGPAEPPAATASASASTATETVNAAATYRELVERSIELERLLARVPAQRPVMSLGTAGTIAGLEQRIALVDAELAVGTARGFEPRYQEALWSERVDLMNALVQVRLAQSQPADF